MSEILKLKESIFELESEVKGLVSIIKKYEEIFDELDKIVARVDLGDE